WSEPADLYILNSCTVTAKADQECRRLARQAKRRAPGSRVVVAGCYAQTQPEALAGIPEIDAVIGNTSKEKVAQWLPEVLGTSERTVAVTDFDPDAVFDSPLIDEFSGRSRAFVKIQDGCNLRCTYCLIWKARGPGRSRTVADIEAQLQALVGNGYRETILAGIHLGGYGRDLDDGLPLPVLLRRILERFPRLRIRLSSIHPNEVKPELLDLFREFPHLRPHLHISLQSGSDTVLKRMKRPYRGQRAWDAMRAVAAIRPDFGIGADIIVGFPGETEEEFEDTRHMVAELPFSYLHVFRFSPRPGTVAADLGDPVMPEAISRRASVLRKLGEERQREFRRNMLGRVREAIVEAECAVPGFLQATTDNYETVLVPGRATTGGLVKVKPVNLEGDKLFAEIVEECHG
ncbi:tRNA (N(6)-L-threonylcarbamoyladenosine(37)-C(2))-methylthiotransferase MtaB, partial [bacterium CG17_big_fil_post_rev_8_21_14_2_50_64_8]